MEEEPPKEDLQQDFMTQHQKSIMDLFSEKPTQEEKERLPPPKREAIPKKLRFDPSKDKVQLEQEADDISELVMAKVRGKLAALKKETQAEESQIKAQIEAKFKELVSPSIKKMEKDS